MKVKFYIKYQTKKINQMNRNPLAQMNLPFSVGKGNKKGQA